MIAFGSTSLDDTFIPLYTICSSHGNRDMKWVDSLSYFTGYSSTLIHMFTHQIVGVDDTQALHRDKCRFVWRCSHPQAANNVRYISLLCRSTLNFSFLPFWDPSRFQVSNLCINLSRFLSFMTCFMVRLWCDSTRFRGTQWPFLRDGLKRPKQWV